MLVKTLAKFGLVGAAAAGAYLTWQHFKVTERLVTLADELLTRISVGSGETTSQENSGQPTPAPAEPAAGHFYGHAPVPSTDETNYGGMR